MLMTMSVLPLFMLCGYEYLSDIDVGDYASSLAVYVM